MREKIRLVPSEANETGGGRTTPPELAELARSALSGDELAATRLWERSRVFLLRLALAFGLQPEDAPGVAQEAMIAAHQHLDSFDPRRGTFEAWIGTIFVRKARNRLRSRRRQMRFLERFRRAKAQVSDEETSSEGFVVARLTVNQLLSKLTDRQREVVALYDVADLDAKEVAVLLGISDASVRSIARQAREKLSRAARKLAPRRGENR